MVYCMYYNSLAGPKKFWGITWSPKLRGTQYSILKYSILKCKVSLGSLQRIGSIFFPVEEAKSAVSLKVPGYQTCLISDASADEEISGGHPSK